jgi:hypothetical protein
VIAGIDLEPDNEDAELRTAVHSYALFKLTGQLDVAMAQLH